MSDVLFKCQGCSLSLSVSEVAVGQTFSCPSCKAEVQVPLPVLRFLCPSCCSELSAPYELRNEVVSCPNCETGLRLPEKLALPCPSCSVNLEIEDEYYLQLAGTVVECPECGGQLVIPGAAANVEQPEVSDEKVDAEVASTGTKASDGNKPVAQFESGFAQKTMRLDEFMEGISQADTLKEGKCPYCSSPLQKIHGRAYVCRRCNRVIKTVKRTI
ncbi:MAG: hypothetical protein A2283_04840 [Lentisphaerae bacterium RIFOXYA12_FULL_48_11]|nr:MAG: hypothetical protein A2283_04840 [Lentisphaerae bacterium RIFOXYA12_FULL_48_11]